MKVAGFILVVVCVGVVGWRTAGKLTSSLRRGLPAGLRDYSLTSYTPLNIIVLHGGSDGTALVDRTFILNLTISEIVEVRSSVKPAARANPCTYAGSNSLFLFGGRGAGGETAEDSLWQLDFATLQWRQLLGSVSHFSVCDMFPSAGGLTIVGDSGASRLEAQYYEFATKSFIPLEMDFERYAVVEVTQWDGSSVQNSIDVESALPTEVTAYARGEFPFSNSSRLRIMSSENSSEFVMRVDGYIYRVYHDLPTRKLVVRFKEADIYRSALESSQFVYWNGWNICGILDGGRFFLTFDREQMGIGQRIDGGSAAYYSQNWPVFGNNTTYSLMMFTSSPVGKTYLVLVQHIVQQVYLLPENVFSELNIADAADPARFYPAGVVASFFGVNRCGRGFTGRNCSGRSCPNSLKLYGENGVSVVSFECSGHGSCEGGVCRCEGGWGGADCGTYLRRSCGGSLLENFPLKNCECLNSTVGGNGCEVVFCPNDCSGRGRCENGRCSCEGTYYGSDCSIMIVGFPT